MARVSAGLCPPLAFLKPESGDDAMQQVIRSRWSTALLVAVAMCVGLLLSNRPAVSYQNDSKPTKWQYNSIQINANELPAKLTELGNDGWEVFSIVQAESKVVSADGSAKVVADKYDVTGRKPAP
jgi:hypothetical protein